MTPAAAVGTSEDVTPCLKPAASGRRYSLLLGVPSCTQNSGTFAILTAGLMAKDKLMCFAQRALLLTFRSLLAQYRITTLIETNSLVVGGAKLCVLAGIAGTVPNVRAVDIKFTPLSSVDVVLVGFDAVEAAASLL
ncbi:hypothetical protein CGC21_7620 [Leishmania donovani]|uniref:Uncharacterized protein n=1 Tax=Leishmania donovani TaxID=5661 RepID=A0A504X6J2_LEIDO|nr:hypothetical protein CGC21_7620 [Leishmania donovani]